MRTALGGLALAVVSAAALWLTISLWIGGSIFFSILVGSVGIALLWALIDNLFVYRPKAISAGETDPGASAGVGGDPQGGHDEGHLQG
jgi:hypothetical protein